MKLFRFLSLIFLLFSSVNIFAQHDFETITTIKIEYHRESLSGNLIILYTYPEGLHQIYPSSFHTIEIRGDRGFTWEEPIYSERDVVTDENEYYENQSLITIPFTIRNERIVLLMINASYQLCDEEFLCFMPQTESHLINFPDEAYFIED